MDLPQPDDCSILHTFQNKAKGKPFLTKNQVLSLLKENYNFEVKSIVFRWIR